MVFQREVTSSRENSARSNGNPSEMVLRWLENFHVWDFIVAHGMLKGKPDWRTVSKYPLSPKTLYKRWRDPDQLVGVRFKTGKGATTSYTLIDIDITSSFHPSQNPDALKGIVSALEDIGLCCHILLRSSNSKGLHLYFSLSEPLPCYGLALAVQSKLQEEGFKLAPGQLEIFPNVKTARKYNGHRLPLQEGSCVLDANLQPIHNDPNRFIHAWDGVAKKQDIDLLRQAIEQAQLVARKSKAICSGNAAEWRDRLEETLDRGWTGSGQTNRIIQEACTYARVFQGLDWDEVQEWVFRTVKELSGYRQFCNHQHEIEKRIGEWVSSNRKSDLYTPFGSRPRKVKASKGPSNGERSADALVRIESAIASIINRLGKLPEGVRERQILICKVAKCSASTLKKHLTLWHPKYRDEETGGNSFGEISAISKEELDLTQSLDETDEPEGCVTIESEIVSGDYEEQGNFQRNSESQSQQGVTHPSLLSVITPYGGVDLDLCYSGGSKEESSKSFSSTTDLIPQETEDSFKELELLNQEGGSGSNHKPTIAVRSTVRRKSDGALFEVTGCSSNNTVSAKWLNQFVPLVGVILTLDEIEPV